MPREFSRTRRVGEQMQRELAVLIRDEVKDPRVGMVTVNDVEVSRDLAHAKVYITVLGDPRQQVATLEALAGAAGFLRRQLGQRMLLRAVPQLHFHYDESVERGSHLSQLIDQAVAEDLARHRDEEE